MNSSVHRFACTQCGKCCNRSPEVELSEAAGLADTFVFRLMFRLYWLPNRPNGDAAAFYERKRLLSAFAARKAVVKVRSDDQAVEHTKYLVLSAISLDTSPGVCAALDGTRCSVHERRPLSCRSVPFHYSRPEALAEADLAAFVATPGYQCDTGDTADVILSNGRIVDPGYAETRADALRLAARDRAWAEAIIRRTKAGSANRFPTLDEVEANARFAATTVPMRLAWQVALEIGLMTADDCARLTAAQLGVIDRELAIGRYSSDTLETLREMRADYARVI